MTVRIITGDCRDVLPTLADGSVNCCVTSPPYWRQRDYGHAAQIGLEKTPEEYVANMVAVFREVRRAMADDGSLWLNLGDKWAAGGNGGGGSYMAERGDAWAHARDAKGWRAPPPCYKTKDLIGLPWMVAFALRADGWFLRQCNIWAKPNGMPESVRDRSTASHEYVFHIVKSKQYFYDANAARTPVAPSSETCIARDIESQAGSNGSHGGGETNGTMKAVHRRQEKQRGHSRRHNGFNDRWDKMSVSEQREKGANLKSVWWISTANYREGHYAVMPEALSKICILCGSKPGDTVLDPFSGAGTTALVADRLGRNAIGIELNAAYADMGKARITSDAPLFAEVVP